MPPYFERDFSPYDIPPGPGRRPTDPFEDGQRDCILEDEQGHQLADDPISPEYVDQPEATRLPISEPVVNDGDPERYDKEVQSGAADTSGRDADESQEGQSSATEQGRPLPAPPVIHTQALEPKQEPAGLPVSPQQEARASASGNKGQFAKAQLVGIEDEISTAEQRFHIDEPFIESGSAVQHLRIALDEALTARDNGVDSLQVTITTDAGEKLAVEADTRAWRHDETELHVSISGTTPAMISERIHEEFSLRACFYPNEQRVELDFTGNKNREPAVPTSIIEGFIDASVAYIEQLGGTARHIDEVAWKIEGPGLYPPLGLLPEQAQSLISFVQTSPHGAWYTDAGYTDTDVTITPKTNSSYPGNELIIVRHSKPFQSHTTEEPETDNASDWQTAAGTTEGRHPPAPLTLPVNESIQLVAFDPAGEDAAIAFEIIQANRAHFKFIPWAASIALSDIERNIPFNRERMERGEVLSYGIVVDGVMAGAISLEHNPIDNTATLGRWLDASYTGQGIGTVAADRVIEYGFNEWEVDAIIFENHKDNEASVSSVEKLGAEQVNVSSTGELTWRLTRAAWEKRKARR